MTQQWRYMSTTLLVGAPAVCEQLDRYGADGWELVEINGLCAIFKRRVDEGTSYIECDCDVSVRCPQGKTGHSPRCRIPKRGDGA